MKMKSPSQEWLRIVAEARAQLPAPPTHESAPAWFLTQTLADCRLSRRRRAPAPWFALPGLARAAIASSVLAAACAVFVFSTGGLEEFSEPIFPEMDELDLP
jgi:hypothetical protein